MKMFFLVIIGLLSSCSTQSPTSLTVKEKTITVNGRQARVYCVEQPDGRSGYTANKGEEFDVVLSNDLQTPTGIHWHGVLLPNYQDGVPFITQYPLYPGLHYHYHFPIKQEGTYWMHSHFNLQLQRLLSAPLIFHGPDDSSIADQEVILFLADFSFQTPEQIFASLECERKEMAMKTEIADVTYDAFLANSRTLENPEVIIVEPASRVRLRIIDGSASSNFFLLLGDLPGEAIAIDGNRIFPVPGSSFELAVGQRIDILVTIPPEGGAFPLLAQGSGTNMQTGIILATKGAPLPLLRSKVSSSAGALTNAEEPLFHPLAPLEAKKVDQKIELILGGSMTNYIWTINRQAWPNVTPLLVKKGERVEITFKNISAMGHPMHLHGHVFEVTAINGKAIKGPLRDTVFVPPNSTLSIQFDANNPGVWPLHCHVLYHQKGGMMTVVRYQDYVQPLAP